jgi:excisionase family DNA binding protein
VAKEVTMAERDLYSIEEARQRLGGISRNTVYLWLRSGKLASVVLGSRRFIAAKAFAALIEASTITQIPGEEIVGECGDAQGNQPLLRPDARWKPRGGKEG